jgi:hypothetical protein
VEEIVLAFVWRKKRGLEFAALCLAFPCYPERQISEVFAYGTLVQRRARSKLKDSLASLDSPGESYKAINYR